MSTGKNKLLWVLFVLHGLFIIKNSFASNAVYVKKFRNKNHHEITQSKDKSIYSYNKIEYKHVGLFNSSFDLNYFGEVDGLLEALSKIDNSIIIKRHVGSRFSSDVNIAVQNVRIEDIADAINVQTNGKITLLYNNMDNSIGLNFHKTMDTGSDAVLESLKWQNGAAPKPVLKADGIVRFPYGEYQPVVTCQPLNLCDIELQIGEEIQGIVIGDSLRWNDGDQGVPIVYSGSAPKLTPHLVLKPSQAGLETSLMVTTSKRTYMIKLKSATTGYVARSGFYYPTEMVQRLKNNKNKLKYDEGNNDVQDVLYNSNISNKGSEPSSMIGMQTSLVNLGKVNYNYTISGEDYPWKPTQVFEDGTSIYIQMPDNIGSRNLPGICVVVENDKERCELVNFRYNDHFYIVDKLFERANLVNGFGDTAQIITIEHNKPKKGFWARLFG